MMRRYDITDPRERAGQSTNGTCQSQVFFSCTAWAFRCCGTDQRTSKKRSMRRSMR